MVRTIIRDMTLSSLHFPVRHCSSHAKAVATLLLIAGLIPPHSGCSGRADRVVLRGKVAFDGKPIHVGTLRFVPSEDTLGPVTIAAIEDGSYVADGHDGVPIGNHKVEVFAYDLTGFVPAPGNQPKQIIPAKYNDETTLSLAVDPSSGERSVDFELTP